MSGKHAGFSHGDDDARVVWLEIFFSGKFGYWEWGEPTMPIGVDVDHNFEEPHGRRGGRTEMVRHDSTEDGSTAGIKDIVYEL